jgi:hypothetical protein
MGTCLVCTMGKSKQKNVEKSSDQNKSVVPGGRVHFDTFTVKSKRGEPTTTKPNCRIVVERTT